MRLIFIPVRSDARLDVAVQGDVLILNDVVFDFTELAEGSRLPVQAIESDMVADDVVRDERGITVSLIWPYRFGCEPSGPITCEGPTDGPVHPEETLP